MSPTGQDSDQVHPGPDKFDKLEYELTKLKAEQSEEDGGEDNDHKTQAERESLGEPRIVHFSRRVSEVFGVGANFLGKGLT